MNCRISEFRDCFVVVQCDMLFRYSHISRSSAITRRWPSNPERVLQTGGCLLTKAYPLADPLRNLPDGEYVLLGHNGRWPNALNRAAILRLPAVQPEEVANGGFPIWRMPTPCP